MAIQELVQLPAPVPRQWHSTSEGGVNNRAGNTWQVLISNFSVLPARVPADRDEAVLNPKCYNWFYVTSQPEDCIY